MTKKSSGRFLYERGARGLATSHSELSTPGKQGWNCVEALMKTPDKLLADLRFCSGPRASGKAST